jgi:dihydroorotase
LTEALKDGTVDVIASDHAPHTPDEKAVEFDLAPFGINGLETTAALILDRFVNSGRISLFRFVELLSTNPARILGQSSKGRIAEGADADITILNLRKETVVDVDNFRSLSRNSPFRGWKLKGAPVLTMVAGKIVYGG